ncbi:hypothetical protein TcasGA2_TC016374 [Tribolium castaneum]|uniref:Uncharacterized protein n=1 Tax=Tribolium castaneum TaxID=7070 RepID=D6WPB1_TRICA|nr:hypothetical protein TcasGA2_TC016374 [Tribolium castaneum]
MKEVVLVGAWGWRPHRCVGLFVIFTVSQFMVRDDSVSNGFMNSTASPLSLITESAGIALSSLQLIRNTTLPIMKPFRIYTYLKRCGAILNENSTFCGEEHSNGGGF